MGLFQKSKQVLAISALLYRLRQRLQLLGRDESLAVGDLFRASYVEALAPFDGMDK